MSHNPDWSEVALLATICLLIYGWLGFQSFLNSLGITFAQFAELARIGSITAVAVSIFIAAECYKLEIIENWTSRLVGGAGLGVVSAFAGSYIWLNYNVTMWLAAVLGAVSTIVAVHVGTVAILLLIDWWVERKNNQSQNQPATSSHRQQRENERSSSSEAERMRTRTRTRSRYRQPEKERDSRYR